MALVAVLLLFYQESKAQGSEVQIGFAEGAPVLEMGPDGQPQAVYLNVWANPIKEVAQFVLTESPEEELEARETTYIPLVRKGGELYLENGTLIYKDFIKYTHEIPPFLIDSASVLTLYVEDHQGLQSNKLFFRIK